MKLSERLARLGTETAFEVLVRARALEAQGTQHRPPRDRRARLRHPRPHHRRRRRGAQGRGHALRALGGHSRPAARRSPRTRPRVAASRPPAEMVVVTPGGKPIMFYAILALVDPGDEVIYPNPGFPIYESMIRVRRRRCPCPIALLEEKGFALDVDQLKQQDHGEDEADHPELRRTTRRAAIIPEAEISRAIADARGPAPHPVLSDEIYSRILYDGKHVSIATMPGHGGRARSSSTGSPRPTR